MEGEIRVELLKPNEEQAYDYFLEACKHSVVQHTLRWGTVLKNAGTDTPLFLIAKNGPKIVGSLPSFLYEGKQGNILMSNPYPAGYGGIIAPRGKEKEKVYEALYAAFLKLAGERNCRIATIVTTPFVRDLELIKKYFVPDYVQTDYIQYVDLRKKRAYSRDVKRNLRKAEAHGLQVTENDSDGNISKWYDKIHLQNMRYLYSDHLPLSFFLDIKKHMIPETAKFLFLENSESELVGGAVLIFHNRVLDVLMRSVDLDYSRKGGTVMLMNHAMEWARKKGFRIFNWQSCGFREDGIYEFNRRFGSENERHYYVTKIVGDISELQQATGAEIEEAYKWHYVLPSLQIKKNIWMKTPSPAFLPA